MYIANVVSTSFNEARKQSQQRRMILKSGKPNNNSLETESNGQPLRGLRGTQNPENLSNPRKYSHWEN